MTPPGDHQAAAAAAADTAAGSDNKVLTPHDHDVLCGRGGLTNHHKGNAWYRKLVSSNRPLYKASPKHTKLMVSKAIVQAVHSQHPPGRFLERHKSTGLWMQVPYKRSVDKTSQALREKDRHGTAIQPLLPPTPVAPISGGGCPLHAQPRSPTLEPTLASPSPLCRADSSGEGYLDALARAAVARAGGLPDEPLMNAAAAVVAAAPQATPSPLRNKRPRVKSPKKARPIKKRKTEDKHQQEKSKQEETEEPEPLPLPTLNTRASSMFRFLKQTNLLPESSDHAASISTNGGAPPRSTTTSPARGMFPDEEAPALTRLVKVATSELLDTANNMDANHGEQQQQLNAPPPLSRMSSQVSDWLNSLWHHHPGSQQQQDSRHQFADAVVSDPAAATTMMLPLQPSMAAPPTMVPPPELTPSVSSTILKLASSPSRLLAGFSTLFDRHQSSAFLERNQQQHGLVASAAMMPPHNNAPAPPTTTSSNKGKRRTSLLDDYEETPLEKRLRTVP